MTKLTKQSTYESNPFNVQIPQELTNLGPGATAFFQEIISTLREQHNATQMGDTSVPWEEMTQVDDAQSFSLGVVGRFLHPTYGIISARYVEFTGEGVVSEEYDFGLIAGFDRRATAHQWAVSTKLADSDKTDTLGLAAGYTRPRIGQFGWVITSGINLHSIRVKSEVIPAVGDRLVWADDSSMERGDSIISVVSVAGAKQIGSFWELLPASIRL